MIVRSKGCKKGRRPLYKKRERSELLIPAGHAACANWTEKRPASEAGQLG